MTDSLNVVGLTGGIASGKSVVARRFRHEGIPVLDADNLGHLVLSPGQDAYNDVLAYFGRDILHPNSDEIDRKALGKKVFAEDALREKLESFTHPRIASMAKRGLEMVAAKGERLAVYEAALLVETGIYKGMAGLVVVSASLENQLHRLCHRDLIAPNDAAIKIASQLPLEEKLSVADYVIENNGAIDEVEAEASHVANTLKQRFG